MSLNTCWLVLNYQCNNRCVFCYAGNTGFSAQENMSLEYAKNLMLAMKESGVKTCLLIGGEPTLYPDLEKVIMFGSELGITMRIVTNGRKFAEKNFLKSLVRAGLTSASISIEAPDEKTGSEIAGIKNAWSESISGIQNALELGFSFNTLTTVNQLNQNHLVSIAKKMHELGVTRILYNFATPNCTPTTVDTSMVLHPSAAAEKIEAAYWQLKNEGIRIHFLPTLPYCLFSIELQKELYEDKPRSCSCHIYTGAGAVFDPRGNLLPCTHLTEIPTMRLMDAGGRLKQDLSLQNLLSDPECEPAKLKKSVWKYPDVSCQECPYWGACIGGCPIFRAAFHPSEYIGKKR